VTDLRERRHGRLYFGEAQAERWSIADPDCESLDAAMHDMRYGKPTQDQIYAVLGAAEAYVHLFGYPLRGVARRQFNDIARAVKDGRDVEEDDSDA
jgi:hypothetical protein